MPAPAAVTDCAAAQSAATSTLLRLTAPYATHPSVSLEEADASFRHRGALRPAFGING
jgi:hypothetical protein